MATAAKLVWIRVNGIVHAEKWAADCPSGARYLQNDTGVNHGRELVKEYPISPVEYDFMSLSELVYIYKAPV
jgi:hypothetical protein